MQNARGWLLLAALLLVGALLLWQFGGPLTALLSDLEALRAWVGGLGVWGPLAIITLGVVQVLVAPMPGYPIVFVAGALFGGWWGALYANIGMMIAGTLAAWLTRTFGRPLAERFLAATQMQRTERLLASDSFWLWFLVLLLPTGDPPYFLAGLSRIPLRRFVGALFLARFPFTFVLTHAAAGATTLPQETLWAIVALLALLAVVGYSQQARLEAAMQRLLGSADAAQR